MWVLLDVYFWRFKLLLGPVLHGLLPLLEVARNLGPLLEALVKERRDLGLGAANSSGCLDLGLLLGATGNQLVQAVEHNPGGHVGEHDVMVLREVLAHNGLSAFVLHVGMAASHTTAGTSAGCGRASGHANAAHAASSSSSKGTKHDDSVRFVCLHATPIDSVRAKDEEAI